MRIEHRTKATTLRPVSEPTFVQRFFLAWRTFFQVWFDPSFAARVLELAASSPTSLPEPEPDEPAESEPSAEAPNPAASAPEGPGPSEGALQLLSLLQREGRFIDFIQQDISKFSDAEIGQAARVVHEGCRRTLGRYVSVEPVLDVAEGGPASVPDGFDPTRIKLTGNVAGSAPYRGILRHKGWRARSIRLPEALPGHSFSILAPAEVEI